MRAYVPSGQAMLISVLTTARPPAGTTVFSAEDKSNPADWGEPRVGRVAEAERNLTWRTSLRFMLLEEDDDIIMATIVAVVVLDLKRMLRMVEIAAGTKRRRSGDRMMMMMMVVDNTISMPMPRWLWLRCAPRYGMVFRRCDGGNATAAHCFLFWFWG